MRIAYYMIYSCLFQTFNSFPSPPTHTHTTYVDVYKLTFYYYAIIRFVFAMINQYTRIILCTNTHAKFIQMYTHNISCKLKNGMFGVVISFSFFFFFIQSRVFIDCAKFITNIITYRTHYITLDGQLCNSSHRIVRNRVFIKYYQLRVHVII